MARHRKKPVVIEAIQWDGRNFEEISNFVGSALDYYINDCAWRAGAGQPVRHLTIKTLEGDMNVNIGDYIIKGVRGEFYPCKPDIFKETYESADTADVAPKSEVAFWQDAAANAKRETAREIFEKFIIISESPYRIHIIVEKEEFDELKKKYGVTDKNVGCKIEEEKE